MRVADKPVAVPQNRPIILSKAYLFRWAWTNARQAAARFGGNPAAYFSESLRAGWAAFRSDPLVRECHRLAKQAKLPVNASSWVAQNDVLLAAAQRFDDRRGGLYYRAF